MSASEIVNKVWNYAHVLRDDGVGYGDYVEQIAYLIFLKMADERDKAGQQVQVPTKFNWGHLVKLDGDAKEDQFSELQYRHTLESLGKEGGMLGTIFRKTGYIRGYLVRLFFEFWYTQYSFEYGYSQKGVKT